MKKVLLVLTAAVAAAVGWAIVVRQSRPGYLGTDDNEPLEARP